MAVALLAVAASTARTATAWSGNQQMDAPTATFTVNSTDDFPDMMLNGVCATAFGTCTLRAAIQEVNNTGGASGPHTIHFNITGAGPHTIQIFSPLPRLERAVVIDGTTEFGATCPTATLTANIKIVIDGTPLGSTVLRGLDLWRNAAAPSGSTIKGVAIGGFGYGVWLEGDGHSVRCSVIGLNADGASALGNQTAGIYVWQGSGITIGGSAYADRNVISENTRDGGISLRDGDAASILGNYIGTSSAGTLDRGNANGILVGELSNNVVIGGTGAAERNVISGNSKGITINGANATVVNNLIGPNALGTAALGNGWGIEIYEPAAGTAIGGGLPSQGNVISGNGVDGIYYRRCRRHDHPQQQDRCGAQRRRPAGQRRQRRATWTTTSRTQSSASPPTATPSPSTAATASATITAAAIRVFPPTATVSAATASTATASWALT